MAGDALVGSFDVDQIEPETLLFQTGYLTIKEKQQVGGAIMYELSFPNLEVKMSLTDHILASLSGAPATKDKMRHALYQALVRGEPDAFRPIFQSFFASIPHDWYRKNWQATKAITLQSSTAISLRWVLMFSLKTRRTKAASICG